MNHVLYASYGVPWLSAFHDWSPMQASRSRVMRVTLRRRNCIHQRPLLIRRPRKTQSLALLDSSCRLTRFERPTSQARALPPSRPHAGRIDCFSRANKDRPLRVAPSISSDRSSPSSVQPIVASPAVHPDITWCNDPDSGTRTKVRLSTYRALVLDSSYRPVGVVSWQRAVRLFYCPYVNVVIDGQ
jgi:hypothetical protein